MRLYLVRHGETVGNVKGIIQGQSPGRLSENGKSQVARLAERLRHEEFDSIYSSDLTRAKDTAKTIHQHHPKIPLKFVKALRERSFGPHEGKLCEDVGLVAGEKWEGLPQGAESDESLRQRCAAFLQKVLRDHPVGSVLFVSHGGTLNALLYVLGTFDGKEIDFIPLHNTSITIVEFGEDKKHQIHLLNCVQHLE